MEEYAGPKGFIRALSNCQNDQERTRMYRSKLKYIKNKGSRDLLIETGIIKDGIALDVRIVNILRLLGIKTSTSELGNSPYYDRLESELLELVCQPLQLSGSVVDRILFQNYGEIINELG